MLKFSVLDCGVCAFLLFEFKCLIEEETQWGVKFVYLLFCRCEFVGGDRKWSVAAGPKRSGEGVLAHQQTKVSADGCTGRTQCSNHYIRYMH